MTSFRYQAIEGSGASVGGVIEAEDRKAALQLLGDVDCFPSSLETRSNNVASGCQPRLPATGCAQHGQIRRVGQQGDSEKKLPPSHAK